jgi:hypothetical protein
MALKAALALNCAVRPFSRFARKNYFYPDLPRKSLHEGFRDSDRYTYVDLNRCGTPLIEIVSEPDMRRSEEAYAFLTELKLLMQFVEVSTCDMEVLRESRGFLQRSPRGRPLGHGRPRGCAQGRWQRDGGIPGLARSGLANWWP